MNAIIVLSLERAVKSMNFTDKISNFFESMTPKGLLLMSLAAGLLAFFLVFMALSGKNEEAKQEKQDMIMVKVVAAKTDIAPRTEIKEDMLRILEVPQGALPEDAMKEMAAIVGKPAKVSIMSGDIITQKKLFPDKKSAGFPSMIPEDCRAVSIAIDDVTGVAGFALPGDYVDVMLVSDRLKDGAITGEMVMQNVLLLGINKVTDASKSASSSKDKKDDKDKNAGDSAQPRPMENPATATLAVRPEEAMRLSVASKVGALYLALRPFRPTNRYVLDTTYSVTFDKSKPQTQPAPTPSPAPAATSAPVRSAPAASSGSSSGASSYKPNRGVEKIEVIRGVQSTKE